MIEYARVLTIEAALAGGKLIALDAYPALGFISAGMMAVALALTLVFFGKEHFGKSNIL